MRKVLLFLLLFGAGFAVLWLLRAKPNAPNGQAPPTSTQPGPFTEVQAPASGDQTHKGVGVILDGPLTFKQYKGDPRALKPEIDFQSSDVDAVSEIVYDVHDLVVHIFDPATGHKRADLVSPLSRVNFAIESGQPRLSETRPTHLTNVDVTLHEGAPVVPIYVKKLAGVDWDFGRRRFHSDDYVDITGVGLAAHGNGMQAELNQSSFVFERDGFISLSIPQGGEAGIGASPSVPVEATLRSTANGPIFMSKLDVDGQEFVEVTAAEGADLVVSGEEPFKLDAQMIHMIGRVLKAPEKGFEVVTADAEGDVRGDSRGDTFRARRADFTFASKGLLTGARLDGDVVLQIGGDDFRSTHAEFEFDTLGFLSKATLTGDPHGIVEVGPWLHEARPELRTSRVEISGAGPLVIDRSKGVDVDLVGPGKVEMRDAELVLTARERIHGSVSADQKTGHLRSTGASKLTHQSDVLTSDTIDVDYTLAQDGVGVVDATTTSATTVDGTSQDGRKFTLVAANGLHAQERNKKLFLPIAHDVVLTVYDPNGMTARARTVRDFAWDTRAFQAEGDTSFVNARGSGEADRAVSHGQEDIELFGTATQLAHDHFTYEPEDPQRKLEGETWARSIHRVGDELDADGDVKSYVVTKDGRLDLDGQHLKLRLAQIPPQGAGAPRPFHVEVRERVHGHVKRPDEEADVDSDVLVLEGSILQKASKLEVGDVGNADLRAEGNVHLVYKGAGDVEGFGDLLTLDRAGKGRLSAGASRRVRANGRVAGTELPYTLDADWLEFDKQRVQSSQVRVKLDLPPDKQLQLDPKSPGAPRAVVREMHAQSLYADKNDMRLDGAAHIEGFTGQGENWWIDAGSIRMQGDFSEGKSITLDRVASLVAQGGFKARLGERSTADGDRLDGVPGRVRVEGQPAHVTMMQADWTSPWIQYDTENMLLSTDKGQIRSQEGIPGPSWSVDYTSMQPFDQGDTTILVLRSPRIRFGSEQLAADWGLFWVDRNEWKQRGGKEITKSVQGEPLRVETPTAPGKKPQGQKPSGGKRAPLDLMTELSDNEIVRIVSEAYVEGNVEIYSAGERFGRASAVYLDMAEMQGWVQDADLSIDLDVQDLMQKGRMHAASSPQERLRAKAEWMRITPGPTLRADKAVITSCDFDEPHYVIEAGDLRITPRKATGDKRVAWGLAARHNTLRFENGLRVPLPPLITETDDRGNLLLDRVVLGDSARFGKSLGASINGQLGSLGLGMGSFFANTLGFPATDIRGNWRYNVGVLGSRGLLLGVGLNLHATDKFKLVAELDAIPDRRSDKGYVRVDKEDRSLLRDWFRARARYTIEKGEWVDVVVSKQSDAGVQSEFFERDYVRYEQKDNYVHWRQARDEIYTSATVKVLLEDRTDIAQLPSASIFRGRLPIGELWGEPLLYTAAADAAYLQRRNGDPRYYAPFPDGLGNREEARIDTEHKLERPQNLGFLGLRGTPFVTARATAWNEGVEPGDTPSRAWLFVGYELATTFWKRYEQGNVHTLTPTLGVRANVGRSEAGGDPVRFDVLEEPLSGQFIDVGLRSRWWKPDTKEHFDVDVRTGYGQNLPPDQQQGLQPVAVLAELVKYVDDVPVAMVHDGRYNLSDHDTIYSTSSVGFEPWPDLGLEMGYHTGLDENNVLLYEAASLGARWRWTPKWEIEFEESYSLIDSKGLGENVLLRRFGHDFVTEIEVGYRAGEGSRFGIGVQPKISWHRSALGLLDQKLGVYH